MLATLFGRAWTHSRTELVTTVLTVVWYILNAWQDWVSTNAGIKLSAPAIAYIISRGLAKYESRGGTPPAA